MMEEHYHHIPHSIDTDKLLDEIGTRKNLNELGLMSRNPNIQSTKKDILTGCGFLLVLASIVVGVVYSTGKFFSYIDKRSYNRLYNESSQLADKIIGDNNGVLEESERLRWNDYMGIDKDTKPTVEQLKVFNGFADAYINR